MIFFSRLDISEIKMNSLLECKICFLIYNENRKPLVLPCGHSYCSTCVKALQPDDGFCPSCRKEISTSFDQLPVVFSLLKIADACNKENVEINDKVDMKKSTDLELKCKKHEEQLIISWCRILEEWLCDICTKNHEHESTEDCIMSIETTMQKFKDDFQKSHIEKFNKIQNAIKQTKFISNYSKYLSVSLHSFNESRNVLLEKTKFLNEKSKEFTKKALKLQFFWAELNVKLNDVETINGFLQTQKELEEIEKILDVDSEFQKIHQLKEEVKYS